MFTCPVCGEEYYYEFAECSNCGFNNMRFEFINDGERQLWIKETVEPCRAVYEKACEDYNSLDEQYSDLDDENDELRDECEELQEKYDELLEKNEQLKKKLSTQRENQLISPSKKEGWDYDDIIAHPNYAKCSYVEDVSICEIYNIACSGNFQNTKVNFYVKKLYENNYSKNSRVHFRWRLKDNDGVIVLTGNWIKDGMMVNDVVRGEISFNNVEANRYTVDFIDV